MRADSQHICCAGRVRCCRPSQQQWPSQRWHICSPLPRGRDRFAGPRDGTASRPAETPLAAALPGGLGPAAVSHAGAARGQFRTPFSGAGTEGGVWVSSALQVGKLLAACNLLLSNMLELSQGSLPPPPRRHRRCQTLIAEHCFACTQAQKEC